MKKYVILNHGANENYTCTDRQRDEFPRHIMDMVAEKRTWFQNRVDNEIVSFIEARDDESQKFVNAPFYHSHF